MVYISFRFLEWVDHDYSNAGVVQQIRVIKLRCKQQILEHNKPVLRSDCYLFRSTTYSMQYSLWKWAVCSEQWAVCSVYCVSRDTKLQSAITFERIEIESWSLRENVVHNDGIQNKMRRGCIAYIVIN